MTNDSKQASECGAERPDASMNCNRDAGHAGDHGYGGVFWTQFDLTAWLAEILALHMRSERGLCHTCMQWGEHGFEYQTWPCPTVRLLAQPYADRPGFQEAWRVS